MPLVSRFPHSILLQGVGITPRLVWIYGRSIGMTNIEILFWAQIVIFEDEVQPPTNLESIAGRMGCTIETIFKHIDSLKKKGFLKEITYDRYTTHDEETIAHYNFQPLYDRISELYHKDLVGGE